jgi:hypothetical protein
MFGGSGVRDNEGFEVQVWIRDHLLEEGLPKVPQDHGRGGMA